MCFKISKGLEKPFKAKEDLYVIKIADDIAKGKKRKEYFISLHNEFTYMQNDTYYMRKSLKKEGSSKNIINAGFHSYYSISFYFPRSYYKIGIFMIPAGSLYYADNNDCVVSNTIVFVKECKVRDFKSKKYGFKSELVNGKVRIKNPIIEKEIKDKGE